MGKPTNLPPMVSAFLRPSPKSLKLKSGDVDAGELSSGVRFAYHPALSYIAPSRNFRDMKTSRSVDLACSMVLKRARNCSSLKTSMRNLMPVFVEKSPDMSLIACDQGWLLSSRLSVCPSCFFQLKACAKADALLSDNKAAVAKTPRVCLIFISVC